MAAGSAAASRALTAARGQETAVPLPAVARAVLVWLLLMLAESAQGALRRALLGPEVERFVRQFSVLTGVLVIFAITWLLRRWLRPPSVAAALGVGALWVAMTVVFEVALGRMLGLGWRDIAADYDLARGGLMPLGLLAMGLTPWAVRALSAR